MQAVPDTGSFTRRNQQIVNQNFQTLTNPDLWVRPQGPNANDNNDGTYENPLASPAGLSRLLKAGMVVGLQGVIFAEYSSPRVNDVTFIGMGNLPRQATTSSIPNGGGATWLSPTGGTGALLQPNGQGWKIQNIFFNCSATAAPAIKLVNAGDPPTANCSEKTSIIGNYITGSDDGISATDLPNNVYIGYNTIFSCSGSGDIGISSSTGLGTGTLQNWIIEYNDFNGNDTHLILPLNSSKIRYNSFSYIYGTTTTSVQISLTGGANNSVRNNYFDIPYTSVTAAMFVQDTNGRWAANQFATAVTTTIYKFGAPTST